MPLVVRFKIFEDGLQMPAGQVASQYSSELCDLRLFIRRSRTGAYGSYGIFFLAIQLFSHSAHLFQAGGLSERVFARLFFSHAKSSSFVVRLTYQAHVIDIRLFPSLPGSACLTLRQVRVGERCLTTIFS